MPGHGTWSLLVLMGAVIGGVSLTQINSKASSDLTLEALPAPSTGPSLLRASWKRLSGHGRHPGTYEFFTVVQVSSSFPDFSITSYDVKYPFPHGVESR